MSVRSEDSQYIFVILYITYRLKQTDYDGKFIYSKIVSINANKNSISRVYSNPNKGSFAIDIQNRNDDIIDIKFLNILGVTVYKENNVYVNGQYQTYVNQNTFNSGIYFVVVQSESGSMIKKVIVQK